MSNPHQIAFYGREASAKSPPTKQARRPHYCIVVALARLELKVVFGSIFQRFPALRLAVAPVGAKLRKEIITGGFERFPVVW